MRSHVTKTVSASFAVLRQLRNIRRSIPRSVLQSLVTSVVMTLLDYGNSTLAGIPLYLLKRLQSVMNSAARLVFGSSRYDHVDPLLRQLHWLMAAERIDFNSLSLLLSARSSTFVPCWWTPPARGLWRWTSSTIRLITIADCPPYAAVNCRRSSFPGRRCSCLERFAAPRHVGTVSGCLLQSPQDTPLQALLSIMPFRCCACEVTLVIFGHIDRFFLLTYLLTYQKVIKSVNLHGVIQKYKTGIWDTV